MKKLVGLAAVLLMLSFTAVSQENKSAPIVSLKDTHGRTVRLGDFKGKVVLLNFWATWCVPCAAEVPQLIKWQQRYKADGLQIIGITYPPTNISKVRGFIVKNKMNYPVLFGAKATKQLFDASDTLPITIIIDKRGDIRGRIDGIVFDDEFETNILPLLGILPTI